MRTPILVEPSIATIKAMKVDLVVMLFA